MRTVYTAYQDNQGRDVCGCCGSYYVITPEEAKVIYKLEAEKVTAERDAAISEVGRVARELGKCEAEITKLKELIKEAANTIEHLGDIYDDTFGDKLFKKLQKIAGEG